MIDRNLARGLVLSATALAFGLGALNYPIGDFSRAGPGLFPLLVSALLLVIGIATIVRSRLVAPEPLGFSFRNIGLLIGALCCFAIVSKVLDMAIGIAVMVFVASFAGTSRSWIRSAKIAAGLIAMAFAFQKLLGLNLPLF